MHFEAATANDLPRLTELLSEPGDPTSAASTLERGLDYALGHPECGVVLVERHEGRVIALAGLFFTVSTAEGGRAILLKNFVVDPAFRSQGCGTRLLRGALDYARQHGFLRITLWAETLDEPARRFFRKHGFSDSQMIPLRHPMPASSAAPTLV